MATAARKQDRGSSSRRRPPPPLARKVHVDGAVWTYQFGRSFVTIRNPDRSQTFRAWLSDIGDLTPGELERRLWKGGWDGIGPAKVKQYIEEQLSPPEHTVVVDGVAWTYRVSAKVVVITAPKEFAGIHAPVRVPLVRIGDLDIPDDPKGIPAWVADPDRRLWSVGATQVKKYIEENLLPPLCEADRERARQILVDVELAVHACVLAYPSLNETRLDILNHWFCVLGGGVAWTEEGVLDVTERGDDRIFRAALRVAAGERAQLGTRPADWCPMSKQYANLLHVPQNVQPAWAAAARETALAILATPEPPGHEGDRNVQDHRSNVQIAKLALAKLDKAGGRR